MTRSHVALAALLLAPVALYAAAVLPDEIPHDYGEPTSPAAFFPTTVGSKWVYRQRTSARGVTENELREVRIVTSVAERDGERIVTVRELEGEGDAFTLVEWAVSEAGLRQRALPDPLQHNPFDKAGMWHTVLPARLVSGASWVEDSSSSRSHADITVAGWETVRVPAGSYHALRVSIVLRFFVRQTKNDPLPEYRGTCWFVPGIGEVKREVVSVDRSYRYQNELLSFTPGPR
jgi:hypothetical protein